MAIRKYRTTISLDRLVGKSMREHLKLAKIPKEERNWYREGTPKDKDHMSLCKSYWGWYFFHLTTVQPSLGKRALFVWHLGSRHQLHLLSPNPVSEMICKAQVELTVKTRDAIIERNHKSNDEHKSQFCGDFSDEWKAVGFI